MPLAHRLKAVQRIPVSLETAWRYFSNPNNLLSITPSSLHLKMTSTIDGDEVYEGQVMTYSVKPLFGIPVFWKTEITKVERMKTFVDDQRKGPYRQWHHQHFFKAIDGGVEMTDLVDYQLPLGLVGNMAHGIIVKPKLKTVFQFRFQKINELFGTWPDAKMDLVFD